MKTNKRKDMEEGNMEEISLRELIGIMNKYKFLIIGVIILSAIISVFYSTFVAVPVYQAQAEVEINKVNSGVVTFDGNYNSSIIVDALLRKMKDLQYAEQVSKILESRNINISNTDLMLIISSSKGANGGTIVLSAKHKEKKEIAYIANAAVDALCELSAQYMREEIQQQLAIIEEQIDLARKNVEAALLDYEENETGLERDGKHQLEVNISEYLSAQLVNDDLISSIEVYKSLKIEYNRLKLFETYFNNNSNAQILSYAIEPKTSSSPDREDMIFLSVIAGLCVGILAAFTIEWFKYEKSES